jgi:hypothetical protein
MANPFFQDKNKTICPLFQGRLDGFCPFFQDRYWRVGMNLYCSLEAL